MENNLFTRFYNEIIKFLSDNTNYNGDRNFSTLKFSNCIKNYYTFTNNIEYDDTTIKLYENTYEQYLKNIKELPTKDLEENDINCEILLDENNLNFVLLEIYMVM
jgi:hypothetical protein